MLFHVLNRNLHRSIWIAIFSSLAVYRLIKTTFIDRFIRDVVPFEPKWYHETSILYLSPAPQNTSSKMNERVHIYTCRQIV